MVAFIEFSYVWHLKILLVSFENIGSLLSRIKCFCSLITIIALFEESSIVPAGEISRVICFAEYSLQITLLCSSLDEQSRSIIAVYWKFASLGSESTFVVG